MLVPPLFSSFTVLAAAVVALLTIILTTTYAETAEQRQALYDFYKATNKGSGWNANCKVGGWLDMDSGGPPVIVCNNASAPYFTNYFGLRCTAVNGNIWRFKFTQCNLQGTLPRSLMALVDLEYVDLWNNLLTGTLHREFISWTKVNYLSVAKNRFTGTLPRHWAALTKLEKLYLDTNWLVGTLPPEWGRLELLTEISVNINQLTGTVPVEWQNGMKVINSVAPCSISGCSWTAGVGGQCSASAPSTCTNVRAYYNCLKVSPAALPQTNGSNTWNWADSSKTKLAPQRTDCPPYQPTPSSTPSLSFTAFPRTATVSNSLSNEATKSGGLISPSLASTISRSGEISSSVTSHALPPQQPEDLFSPVNVIRNPNASQGLSGWSNNDCQTTSITAVLGETTVFTGPSYSFNGPDNCSMFQVISLSGYPDSQLQLIDQGHVKATLSAYLGGLENKNDVAIVTVAAFSDNGTQLFSPWTLPGVTAETRNNETQLLLQARSFLVPRGTRSVRVSFRAIKQNGGVTNENCDAYATGLSLQFRRRTDSVSLSPVQPSLSTSSSSSESRRLSRTDTKSHVARVVVTPSPSLVEGSQPPTTTTTPRVVGKPTPSQTITATAMNDWCGLLPPPALRWSSVKKPRSANDDDVSPMELPLLTWNSLTSATMLGNDAIGKRCLGWLHVTMVNQSSSGDEGSGGNASSSWFEAVSLSRHVRVLANDKEFQNEFDNITVIPSTMDDAQQNRTTASAEVWLCTTIPQGFRLGGLRNTAMWVQLLLPMHCGRDGEEEPRGLSPFFLSRPFQLRLVYPAATSSSTGRASDVTTLGDASQWSKARNAVPVTRTATRVIPMLQRTGATGCGDEVDPGLYSFDDTSMHPETQRVGSLFGNLLAVLALYLTASVGSLCISVALHRRAVGWHAVRESHVASLWMPIVAMVLVPLTTNSVALIVDADATSVPGWVAAVVSLLAVAGYVGYVSWVGVTAQNRLQMELATALQQQRVMKGAWWVVRALLKPETHWVARTADDVPFKRHHQITLEPATVWWYNTFEALLGVLIGIVCGISQATGSPRPGCIASLSVAMSSQLLLFGIVVVVRPHSNLLGHHFTCCTALLSAIISALQLVTTFVVVESSTAAALLEGTAALTLVMAGASLVQYALMAVGVLLWMMPRRKRRESKHLQVPQANKTTKVRGATTRPIRISEDDAEAEVEPIPLVACSSQEGAHKTASAQDVAETRVHNNNVNGLHEPKLACNPSTTVVVEGNEDEHSNNNNEALDEQQHEEVTPYKSQRYFDGLSESQRQLRSYLQQALTGTLNQDELLSSSPRGNSFSFSFAEHTAQQPNRQASLTREPSSQAAMKRRRGSSRTSRGRR